MCFTLPQTYSTVGHQGTRKGSRENFLAHSWKCSFPFTLLASGQTKFGLHQNKNALGDLLHSFDCVSSKSHLKGKLMQPNFICAEKAWV